MKTNEEVKPTSHDYARELQRVAEFLLGRDAFTWPNRDTGVFTVAHCWQKESFLEAVKGLGHGTKKFTDSEVQFSAKVGTDSEIRIYVPRDKVCRLVRAAEYECEPFLSDEELSQVGK